MRLTDYKAYSSWQKARQRCHDIGHKDYPSYGNRGLRMCERWRNSFLNFLEDMGERPSNMTLDRIDNDKGYNPKNCRWATRLEQVRNRRCTLKVEGVPFAAVCERRGQNYDSVYTRTKQRMARFNLSFNEAFSRPLMRQKILVSGIPLWKYCKDNSLNYNTVYYRITKMDMNIMAAIGEVKDE